MPTSIKRTLLTLCLALGCSFPLFAQDILSGQLIDSVSQAPLAYVRLSWTQAQRGTLTNTEGRFQLRLPADPGDTLEIYSLGYRPLRIPRRDIEALTLNLALAPQDFTLEAVTILGITPEELLRRAIERVPENHPVEDSRWEAFYRCTQETEYERLRVEGKDVSHRPAYRLEEALVEVHVPAFTDHKDPQVKLLKTRSHYTDPIEEAWTNETTAGILAAGIANSIEGGITGKLPQALDYDPLDKLREKLKNRWKLRRGYDVSLKGVMPYRGRVAYWLTLEQRTENRNTNYDYSIYLDTATLAFMTIKIQMDPDTRSYAPVNNFLYLQHKFWDQSFRVDYQQQAERWELAHISIDVLIADEVEDGAMFQDFQIRAWSRYHFDLVYLDRLQQPAPRMSRDERFLLREHFSEESGPYDPDFWEGEAVLPLEARLAEQMR